MCFWWERTNFSMYGFLQTALKSAETRISNACGFVSMFYTRFTVGTCISHTGADFGSRLPAMMDARYKSQLYLFCSHFRFKGPGIVLIICRQNFQSQADGLCLQTQALGFVVVFEIALVCLDPHPTYRWHKRPNREVVLI